MWVQSPLLFVLMYSCCQSRMCYRCPFSQDSAQPSLLSKFFRQIVGGVDMLTCWHPLWSNFQGCHLWFNATHSSTVFLKKRHPTCAHLLQGNQHFSSSSNIRLSAEWKIYLSYKFKFKSWVLQVRYPTTLPWRFIFVFTFQPRFASFPEIVWHWESVPKSK